MCCIKKGIYFAFKIKIMAYITYDLFVTLNVAANIHISKYKRSSCFMNAVKFISTIIFSLYMIHVVIILHRKLYPSMHCAWLDLLFDSFFDWTEKKMFLNIVELKRWSHFYFKMITYSRCNMDEIMWQCCYQRLMFHFFFFKKCMH